MNIQRWWTGVKRIGVFTYIFRVVWRLPFFVVIIFLFFIIYILLIISYLEFKTANSFLKDVL